jgi:ABC-2 type transport system permease protein
MTRLIRAEVLRLRSTRTYWALALGALLLIIAGVAALSATTRVTPGTSPVRTTLELAGLAQTCALIAGVLSVTSEFRHRTITAAVLITPRRTRLLAARLFTVTAAGAAFGLLATGAATTVSLCLLASRHIPAHLGGAGLTEILAGGAIATGLAAALGVGIGFVLRNQTGAIIAVLGLLYVAEPLLGAVPRTGTAVQTYGLGGLVSGATGTAGFPATARLLGQVPAALVLAAYALGFLLAGAALLRRRDITV